MEFSLKLPKATKIKYLEANEKKSKVPPNVFRGFEVKKKIRLTFSKPEDSMKGKCYVFSDYKQRNKQ